MYKKLIVFIIGLISVINVTGQSSWSFVGPYSNNNASGAEFETGQMTKVIASPYSTTALFASSQYGGLWKSTNSGTTWTNINMFPTGLDQTRAIAIMNPTEILVGNYHNSNFIGQSYSNRVSIYNTASQTWFNFPSIPLSSKYVIKCVAVHPQNQSIVYAGTSNGLYRYDANTSTWTLAAPNCFVECIQFTSSDTCFISGSDVPGAYPNHVDPTGQAMVKVSTDPGNSIFSNVSTISLGATKSHTEICKGPGGVFALTIAFFTNTEVRYLHQIQKVGAVFTTTQHTSWGSQGGPDRSPIVYDAGNNWVWMGSQFLQCYDLTDTVLYTMIKNTFPPRTINGFIHDDIHGFCINSSNELVVANDGGIAKGLLTNLSTTGTGLPNQIYFNRLNNGLNISLVNGFSGSEMSPNLYALGCQDIVNSDIYDANLQQNIKTHYTWENDGAFIDKYDENLMIWDVSSYSNEVQISLDKGVTPLPSTNPSFPTGPYAGNPIYSPNAAAPFSSSNVVDNTTYNFGAQRTVQDPYRPKRIFEVGRAYYPGFAQFDYVNKKFLHKVHFDHYYFPGLSWYQTVIDLSFSPQTKNSLHIITSPHSLDNAASDVIKYVGYDSCGIDIDSCWLGHRMLWEGDAWASCQLWQRITPDYPNFSSIGGGAGNIAPIDSSKISFRKIETSPWNKNVVYVACNIDNVMPNLAVKVIKYTGSAWVNYSTGIPADEMVTGMEMDYFSNDALYLSTEMHTYYRNATMSSWVLFSNGLPSVSTTQMEINYHENTVRVGTYGRGIWKSPLDCPTINSIAHSGTVSPNIYEANTITSTGIASMTTSPTVYRATKSIIMNPGFKAAGTANDNTYFYGVIHGCNTPGSSFRNSADEDPDWAIEQIREQVEQMEQELTIYPNPAKDIVTIEWKLREKTTGRIVVSNILGQPVKTIMFSDTESNLNVDVSDYKNGVYTISLYLSDKLLKTQKLIIHH